MGNTQGGGEDYLDKALDKVEQMAGKKVHYAHTITKSHAAARIMNSTTDSSYSQDTP